MTKAIGYAYPTSATASRLGAGKVGCWYVVTYDNEGREDDILGPFPTVEAAEACAVTVAGDWSRFTKRAA